MVRVEWDYGPRRASLDKILVDAAAGSGAEVREGFNVDSYLFEKGRLAGIRGRGRNGASVEERATITVGADGRNSRLARTVQAPVYNYTPPLLFYYLSYWSDVQSVGFELYLRPDQRRAIFSHLTDDGLFAIFQGFPMEEFPAVRGDIEAHFLRTIDSIPGFGERIRSGRRVERFYGASDLANFYRRPWGPGWALVGDAGLHKDPYMALGVRDAFRDAELLTDAIVEGLGSCPLDDALTAYETRRNQASSLEFEENLAAARLRPPPEVYALRAAVRDNPAEARRMMKARMRMIDPAGFFNPENLGRLLGKTARAPGA
jgi:flavin-dependent dehydrogenase